MFQTQHQEFHDQSTPRCLTSVPERPQKLNVGMCKVRTMREKGKFENIKMEMKKLKIKVLGLSEIRWKM